MNRRVFLRHTPVAAFAALAGIRTLPSLPAADTPRFADTATGRDWLARWETSILRDAKRNRYCDRETGEELGWLVSPFLEGFRYGFVVTRKNEWLDRFDDWFTACRNRAVTEPDGYLGWPKGDGGGGSSAEFKADSLLGEAMLLRPVVLLAKELLQTKGLDDRWPRLAKGWLEFAERIFAKWDSRGGWRATNDGGVWVVPAFGIDLKTGRWLAGWERRQTDGFTNPANKLNHIARWLLALHDATGKPVYRDRAAAWFRTMKARLRLREGGKYLVWNYWDPAGPWDRKPDGSLKHWVGVHPNGGYYGIDVEGIVAAFEHGLSFDQTDLDRLVATNRDFMWNQAVQGAKFRRIDGGEVDERWKNSPGVLWTALIPYDRQLREIFVANHQPDGWGGLGATPWFLSLPPA